MTHFKREVSHVTDSCRRRADSLGGSSCPSTSARRRCRLLSPALSSGRTIRGRTCAAVLPTLVQVLPALYRTVQALSADSRRPTARSDGRAERRLL